jgi:hypothetical protein
VVKPMVEGVGGKFASLGYEVIFMGINNKKKRGRLPDSHLVTVLKDCMRMHLRGQDFRDESARRSIALAALENYQGSSSHLEVYFDSWPR